MKFFEFDEPKLIKTAVKYSLFFFLFLFLGTFHAFASTYLWTGSGDGTSWTDIANWSSSDGGTSYPGADSSDVANINIQSTITLTSNITIAKLELPAIASDSYSVTISGSYTLTATTIETSRATLETTDTSLLILDCNVTADTMIMHSGASITLNGTCNITNVVNWGNASTTLTVNGSLTSTSIDLNTSSALTLVVSSTGTVTTGTLVGAANSVVDNGTIITTSAVAANILDTSSSHAIYSDTATNVYWTGANGTDAFDDGNWTLAQSSWGTKTVYIGFSANNPVLSSGTLPAANLQIIDGAILTVESGAALSVTSSLTVDENSEISGAGTISAGALKSGKSISASSINVSGTSALAGTIDTSSAASGTSQTYTGEVTLTGDTTIKCGASDVVFGAKVNGTTSGAQSLVVENTGEVTFSDTVGTTKALKSFSCGIGNVKFAGGANGNRIKAAGDISFGGTVSSDSLDMIEIISGGTVATSGAITVEKLLLRSLDSTSLATFNLDSVEHSVSKVACENCTELSLKTSGDIEVTSLTAWDSGSTVVNGIRASGDISLDAGSGGKIKLNYASSNTDTVLYTDSNGGVNFKSPVVLEKDSYIEADDGVFFDSSVDGGYVLGFIHNSNVVFSGNVGESTGLSGLDSWGPVKFNSGVSISVTGTAEFNAGFIPGSPLKLSGNAIIKKFNTLSDVEIDNSSFGSASIIKFEGGETQTIGTLSVKGSSGNVVTLDSTDSSVWKANFTTVPTNSSFEYVEVKNSKSETLLPLYSDSATIADGGNTTNWFTTKFYWLGKNSTSWLNAAGENWAIDEDGANLLPSGSYPPYTGGSAEIVILDSAANELDVSDYSSDIAISTLAVGSSSVDTSNEKPCIVLGDGNIVCSSADSSAVLFANYGYVKFTGSGRICNSSSAAIMDNAHGTVQYTNVATITDYGSSDSDDDYYNLEIIGEANQSANIKAKNSFTVSSTGKLTLLDTAEINSEFTNGGILVVDSGASAIWADFTNSGTVNCNGSLWIADGCTSVTDTGSWSFGTGGVIMFNGSSDMTFDAEGADSANEYVLNLSSLVTVNLTFTGRSDKSKISSFTDGTRSGECIFSNVQFLSDTTFKGKTTSNSGTIALDAGKTIENAGSKAVSFTNLEIPSGGTLTNSSSGTFSVNSMTLGGQVTLNGGDSDSHLLSVDSIVKESSVTSFNIETTGYVNIGAATDVQILTIGGTSVSGGLTLTDDFTASSITIGSDNYLAGAAGKTICVKSYWKDMDDTSDDNFIHNNSIVKIPSDCEDTVYFSGNSKFYQLIAENLGGKTIDFTGDFTVDGTLTLTGYSTGLLLKIDGTGSITLSSSQDNGEFLEVGENVTIGIDPNDGSEATITYTAWNSFPTGAIPYGWLFNLDYYWTGDSSTDWQNAGNWILKGKGGGYVASVNYPGDVSSNVSKYCKAFVLKTNPSTSSDVPRFPILSAGILLSSLTVGEDSELHLDSYGMELVDAFSNSGDIYLYGTQLSSAAPTIVMPTSASTSAVTENGTWRFFGGSTGTGTVCNIENHSFKNVVIEGSGKLGAELECEKLTFEKDSATSSGVTLTASDDSVVKADSVELDLDSSSLTAKIDVQKTLSIQSSSASVCNVSGKGTFLVAGGTGGESATLNATIALDTTDGKFESTCETLNLRSSSAISVTAAEIKLANKKVTINKQSTFNAPTTTLGGYGTSAFTLSGSGYAIAFSGDVVLSSSASINAKPTFGSDSSNSVTGNSTSINFSVSGDCVFNAASVTTSGSQTYSGAVQTATDFLFKSGSSSISFASPLTASAAVTFNVASTKTVSFGASADFSQTDKAKYFTVESGTLSVGIGKFDAGILRTESGTSFVQSGINTSDGTSAGSENIQSVYGIENEGSCAWDSTEKGGTLSLSGSVTGTNAANVAFNKKNVTIRADGTFSGIFYDLNIPSGRSVTNGSGIVVRRNLTVEGTYTHNGQTLTLGGIAVGAKTYSSETGTISDSSSASFGDVAVNALGNSIASKTFASDFSAGTIDFDSANPIEKLIFGGSSVASVTFGISSSYSVPSLTKVILASETEFVSGANTITFESPIDSDSASSSNFGMQIGNSSNETSVVFSGIVGGTTEVGKIESFGDAQVNADVHSADEITMHKTVTFDSGCANFVSDGNQYFYGDVSGNSAVSIEASSSTSKIEFFFVNYSASSSQTLSADGGIFIYLDDSKTWSGDFTFESPLGIFGPSYSADDPRYSGSDTRFEMFLHGSYTPSGTSATLSGGSFTCDSDFYVNGADLSGISIALCDNSSASPVFNSTSSATSTQWGNPFAVAFNCALGNVSVSGSYLAAAENAQNCTDSSENTNVNFDVPKIVSAYSVYDDVICIEFNMPIENSNDEIRKTVKTLSSSSVENGGIWYSGKSLRIGNDVYTDADCTSLLASDTDLVGTSGGNPKIYIKTSSEKWNTDATASSSGFSESTDRSGISHSVTTDLSMSEGMFYAAEGHTMSRNYGTNLEKDSSSSYSSAESYTDTEDHCKAVLVGVGIGQELHSDGTKQEFFDSHNFIEFVYSEPVDIGDLSHDAGDVNVQSSSSFASAASHGGAIVNGTSGFTVAGFAGIENGKVSAGIKTSDGNGGWSGAIDEAKPHALYRKFSLTAGEESTVQQCRIRLSVAGYVDEANPIDGYNNYLGYIESAVSPSGNITRISNDFITDLAVDVDGNALKNGTDGVSTSVHPLPALSVNGMPDASSSVSFESSDSTLYSSWDVSAPVFALYVDGSENLFSDSDSGSKMYEIIGMTNSRSATYLYNVELHLHDNARSVYSGSGFSWLTRTGWQESGTTVVTAPEYSGGSRMFVTQSNVSSSNATSGGIRKSSLDGASSAFTYKSVVGTVISEEKSFNTTGISQSVLRNLFFEEGDASATTKDDGSYIAIPLCTEDQNGHLSLRTKFIVYYKPGTADDPKSFITDLAGNRLVMTDDGSDMKTMQSVDIAPPNFTLTLAPIGHDKIDMVFSKEIYFGGKSLATLKDEGGIDSAMELIRQNMKISGNADFTIEKLEFGGSSGDYTEFIATLDREVSLDDIPGTYIELDNSGLAEISGYQSYIRDSMGNVLENSTKHIISDFAVNAVKPLYAFTSPSEGETEENWFDSFGIYGGGDDRTDSTLYSVHDFTADSGSYGKLRESKDIALHVSFDGDGSTLELIPDLKSELDPLWISSNINTQLGVSWRVWLPELMTSVASSYNDSPLQGEYPTESEISGQWIYIFQNEEADSDSRNWKSGDEVQFIFKIGDTEIDHDGDGTNVTSFYALTMPESRISAGDFSFLDLWSFHFASIKSQRGGVSVLNNVINSNEKENVVIKVDMPSDGLLNVYVMTLDGNVIKRFAKGKTSSGTHYYKWDGTNTNGKPVARGLYFVRVSGTGIDETRKVMVIK
ncbi:MAG: hypothetical protein K6B43_13200 [Treponema sp.]|nr:hypothetical protein [Treponema sp.]